MELGDPATLIGSGLAALSALVVAVKVVWGWLTGLIDRFQAEATNARKDFIEEAKQARQEFLAGLDKIEARRIVAEDKLQDAQGDIHHTLVGIHELLRERGVPGPEK